jgi:tetratricopeptide (TPR) repeat protein
LEIDDECCIALPLQQKKGEFVYIISKTSFRYSKDFHSYLTVVWLLLLFSLFSYKFVMYKNIGEYSKALLYYEKALAIKQQSLPANHSSLASSYNNIGLLYEKIGNYSKAYSFYERAVKIAQQSLPSDHPHLRMYQEELAYIKTKL